MIPIYFLHPNVSVKLVDGTLQYSFDADAGILAVLLYGLLILSINDTFPMISIFVGVSIVVPFVIGLITLPVWRYRISKLEGF